MDRARWCGSVPGVTVPNADACLVVPVFNEGPVVAEVLREALTVFGTVIAVDDGSVDDSAAQVASTGAVLVRHPINLGQGAALQTGFEAALSLEHVQYAVTFDSDGQHDVADADRMVARLRTGEADVVLGSRFLDGRTRPGLLKRAVLWGAVRVTNAQTGTRLTDAHNGLRALNRRALEAVRLRQNGMAHASEIVEQLAAAGLRVVEEPVHIRYTDYSRSKGQSVLNAVNILTDLAYR